MIIGFLGKGGSGKSTLSAAFTRWLHEQDNTVLAIDADHNMDLLFNLDGEGSMNYLGSALTDLLTYCGLNPASQKYYEAFFQETSPVFTLTPPDSFTQTYTKTIKPGLLTMAAGPHTDNVLYGRYCSHSLGTPLKVYLPFLQLQNHEYVVVDEKAGSDGAGTGISSGLDVAFIVLEPTKHGIKAAKQIGTLLAFYQTPYAFVLNKVMDASDQSFAQEALGQNPIASLGFDKSLRDQGALSDDTCQAFDQMLSWAHEVNQSDRVQRSRTKFKNNKHYEQQLLS